MYLVLPLLSPGFLSGWIYIVVISLVVFALWDAGNITAVAALGVLMTLFLIVVAFIVQTWQRRIGILQE